MSDAVLIESREVDGQIYLSAVDVTKALRQRADYYDTDVLADTDPAEADTLYELEAVYRFAAKELRERADAIDFATIAHTFED